MFLVKFITYGDRMGIREELIEILKKDDLLPVDSQNRISGPDLYEKIKSEIFLKDYSKQYILNIFASLVKDPLSPIAKNDTGYGYYRRPVIIEIDQSPAALPENAINNLIAIPGGLCNMPEEKFRAFYMRWLESEKSYPKYIDHLRGMRQPQGVNKWKFPDVVALNWEVGSADNETGIYNLDKSMLAIKQSLGDQPFKLTSVELKVDITLSTAREYFFQCVSNSKWAHHAHLVIAKPITEQVLSTELRRLGTSFGVSIISFGLSDDFISDLPNSEVIENLTDDEILKLLKDVQINKLSTSTPRDYIDWDHIQDLKYNSPDFTELFEWISRCLLSARSFPFYKYKAMIEQERKIVIDQVNLTAIMNGLANNP